MHKLNLLLVSFTKKSQNMKQLMWKKKNPHKQHVKDCFQEDMEIQKKLVSNTFKSTYLLSPEIGVH